jgi:hypothetical protein
MSGAAADLSLLEGVPQAVAGKLSSFVDDLVAVILERDPTRFIKAHYIPVVGAEQSLVTFELDWEAICLALDLELLPALRAMGLELPRGYSFGHRLDSSVSGER